MSVLVAPAWAASSIPWSHPVLTGPGPDLKPLTGEKRTDPERG